MRKEVAGKFQSAIKKEEKYRYLSGIYKALHNLSQNTHKHTQCNYHHSKIRFDILAYQNRT
jgi:sulfur transfer protein SufE